MQETWTDLVAWWFDGFMPTTFLAVMVMHVGIWFVKGTRNLMRNLVRS